MFEAKVKAKSDKELSITLKEISDRGIHIDTSELEARLNKEQQAKIESKQKWKIPDNLHPNIKLASNLVFISLGLGVVSMFFAGTSVTIGGSTANQLPGIISALIVAGFGYAIRLGISWIRILLLIFYIVGTLPGIALTSFFLNHAPVAGAIFVLQTMIQFFVLLLLFKRSTSDWYKHYKIPTPVAGAASSCD